jgi:putative ABC transport system ATP-binding protein
MKLIEATNLSYTYSEGGKVIRFPDFSLQKGRMCAVVGHSGCGKTTFMHLLALLLTPASGSLFFEGKETKSLSSAAVNKIRGGKMGLLFQQNWLVKSISVAENIKSACFFSGKHFDKKFFSHLCSAVSVETLLDKFPHELSGGERQRVCLVKALIHRPEIVFADEPTSQADDGNAEAIVKLLSDLTKESETSLLVITHDNRIKPFFADLTDLSNLITS